MKFFSHASSFYHFGWRIGICATRMFPAGTSWSYMLYNMELSSTSVGAVCVMHERIVDLGHWSVTQCFQ